jgi:hypothetical protein
MSRERALRGPRLQFAKGFYAARLAFSENAVVAEIAAGDNRMGLGFLLEGGLIRK